MQLLNGGMTCYSLCSVLVWDEPLWRGGEWVERLRVVCEEGVWNVVTQNLISGDVRHIEPFSKHGPDRLAEVWGIGRSFGGLWRSTQCAPTHWWWSSSTTQSFATFCTGLLTLASLPAYITIFSRRKRRSMKYSWRLKDMSVRLSDSLLLYQGTGSRRWCDTWVCYFCSFLKCSKNKLVEDPILWVWFSKRDEIF